MADEPDWEDWDDSAAQEQEGDGGADFNGNGDE
jgi:hypothetical protein